MATKIQLRRDLAASWTDTNPTLAQGEPGLETDTGKIKYGTGTTAWADLEYAAGGDLLDGNLDVTRNAQGTLTTLQFNPDTNSGQLYHDAMVRTLGNIYLAGGFYSSTANNDDDYISDAPVITKVDAAGNVVASKFIWQTGQTSWAHASGVTVNPTTGNITLAGTQYFTDVGSAAPIRHEISANLTAVTSTRYEIPSSPNAYTNDSTTLPNGSAVIVGYHSNGIDVTYSNVQAHPGSYTHYLGLDITETFGANSTPVPGNGWAITGYNTGGSQSIDSVNEFEAEPSSSTSSDGYGSLWLITYTPASNVYVVSDFMGGTQYLTGDAITIHGNELGGNVNTNDLTITVGNVDGSGSIVDFVTSGVAQTELIWLYESTGINFGNLAPGEQWNVIQSTNDNGWVMTDSWVKSIGGSSYDYISGVAADLGGNIYLGGEMFSGQASRGDKVASVTKLDSSGELQWTKFVDTTSYETVESVAVDTTGNVIVVGDANNDYMFVGKMNPSTGAMYWRTTIGTDGEGTDPMGFNSKANPVFAADGNVIVAGEFSSVDSQGDDIFVASLNINTGAVIWQRALSSSGDQNFRWNNGRRALATDGDNYYVSYYYSGNTDYSALVKLPVDGTDPVELGHDIEYQTQEWLTYTETDPSVTNDDDNFVQVSAGLWTPNVMVTSLVDTLTYTTASTVDLYAGETGYIKGITHLEFEDGTVQTSAAISPDSTFAGTDYDTMNIRVYNGGINFYWNGADDVEWFNSDNAPRATQGWQVTGVIIEYQLYDDWNYGTQIGTIHASGFYDQGGSAAHTEHWTSGGDSMMYNQPWILGSNNYNQVRLYYRGQPDAGSDIKIQWTARVFYGQENNC